MLIARIGPSRLPLDLILGFAAAIAAACDSGGKPESSAADSQAQRAPVVTNPAPSPEHPAFALAPTPVVVLGGQRVDTEEELWSVVQAVLTPDLEVIVTYNRGRDLRRYDARGRLLSTIGRTGAGPGEFRRITQVVSLAADTIAVFDQTSRRISIFTVDGTFIRSIHTMSGATLCCTATGVFLDRAPITQLRNDGTIQNATWTIHSIRAAAPDERGVRAPTISLPSDPARVTIPDPGSGYSVPNMPFRLPPIIRLADSTILSATGERYEYMVVGPDGSTIRTVRAALDPDPITDDIIAAERARFGAVFESTDPALFRAFRTAFDAIDHPPTFPAFDRVLTEEDGSVWIRRYGSAGAGKEWWARFNGAGNLLGTLHIPPDSRVIRFTRGHAILARTDSVGFDRLSVFPIRTIAKP